MERSHSISRMTEAVQTTIFDAIRANRLADAGVERAARGKGPLLDLARRGAVEIARSRESKTVTADDVQAWLVRQGIEESKLGNAAGSVFRGPQWRYTGVTVKSQRPASHGRLIRVWELVF